MAQPTLNVLDKDSGAVTIFTINANGQDTMANSSPVTIASNQTAIPASQSGTWNVTNVSGTVSLPTGAATSAAQTTAQTSLTTIATNTPAAGQAAMAASSPVVIASDQTAVKTCYKLVKVTTTVTRPSDTTAYAIGDAITNSTSAPVVFQLDIGAAGAANGDALEIRKFAIVSSIKQSTLPLINAFLAPATFTGTNDNAALDIDDTTMNSGGSWFNCTTQNFTASNARVEYISPPQPFVLAAADTKIYGELQAGNAYTPGSAEVFTIIAWVAILK